MTFNLAVSSKRYKISGNTETVTKEIAKIPRIIALLGDFVEQGLTTEIEVENNGSGIFFCYIRYRPLLRTLIGFINPKDDDNIDTYMLFNLE